jgi:hypothetical protein
MSSAFSAEAIHIHEMGHLSIRDIARATGADETSVRAWVRQTRAPSGIRAERLAELSFLVDRLARVIKPDYIQVWMLKPNALLGDEKPLDVVSSGGYREVSRIISGFESTPAS